jgi:hypothetical protein
MPKASLYFLPDCSGRIFAEAHEFAAVGIVAAGVAMMMGCQSIAKWAFAGAMVSGLAFAIVRTMWSNMGLEASGVSTFAP